MSREAANEVEVAWPSDHKGVIASVEGGICCCGIACIEVLVCHSHHVVELLVVLEHCPKENDNKGITQNQKLIHSNIH